MEDKVLKAVFELQNEHVAEVQESGIGTAIAIPCMKFSTPYGLEAFSRTLNAAKAKVGYLDIEYYG